MKPLDLSWVILNNAGKGNVFLHLFDLDSRLLAWLTARDNHDVTTFDFCNTVSLVADRLDRHVTYLALSDWWPKRVLSIPSL